VRSYAPAQLPGVVTSSTSTIEGSGRNRRVRPSVAENTGLAGHSTWRRPRRTIVGGRRVDDVDRLAHGLDMVARTRPFAPTPRLSSGPYGAGAAPRRRHRRSTSMEYAGSDRTASLAALGPARNAGARRPTGSSVPGRLSDRRRRRVDDWIVWLTDRQVAARIFARHVLVGRRSRGNCRRDRDVVTYDD
jgi:hypothetical protein